MRKPTPVRLPDGKFGVDIARLVQEGIDARILAEAKAEVSKRGVMRGGSQGLFFEGTSVGQCHRKAHARMLGGIGPLSPEELEVRRRKQMMFDSGHRNEDTWKEILDASSWTATPGNVILREEEMPVKWRLLSQEGRDLDGSGREDIILARLASGDDGVLLPDGRRVVAVQALELKQVSSINTATETMLPDGAPKLDNAAQAGRYCRELGVPGQLWYSLPFVIPIPSWSFLPSMPARGEPCSEWFDYGKDGRASKWQPSLVGYHLAWHQGTLHYCRVGQESGGWFSTIVTEDRLDDFWHMTTDLGVTRDLGPRPKAIDIHGNRKFYSPCNYCEWQRTCDAFEGDYEGWESAVLATGIGGSNVSFGSKLNTKE